VKGLIIGGFVGPSEGRIQTVTLGDLLPVTIEQAFVVSQIEGDDGLESLPAAVQRFTIVPDDCNYAWCVLFAASPASAWSKPWPGQGL
jgi:hypothetical protein